MSKVSIFSKIHPFLIISRFFLTAPYKKDENGNWSVSWPLAIFGTALQTTTVLFFITKKLMAVPKEVFHTEDVFLILSVGHLVLLQIYRIFLIKHSLFRHKVIVKVSFLRKLKIIILMIFQCLNCISELDENIEMDKKHYNKFLRIIVAQIILALPVWSIFVIKRLIDDVFDPLACIIISMNALTNHLNEVQPALLLIAAYGYNLAAQNCILKVGLHESFTPK